MTMITLTAESDYSNAGKQFVARILGRNSKYTFDREFIGKRSGKRNDITTADVDEPGLYETRDLTRKGNDDSYCLILPQGAGLVQKWIDKEGAMKVAKEIQNGRDVTRCTRYLPADLELFEKFQELEKCRKKLSNWDLTQKNITDPEAEVWVGESFGPFRTDGITRARELVTWLTDRVNELEPQVAEMKAAGKREKSGWKFISAADEEREAKAAEKAKTEEMSTKGLEAAYAALKDLPEKKIKKALAELKKRLTPAKTKAEA